MLQSTPVVMKLSMVSQLRFGSAVRRCHVPAPQQVVLEYMRKVNDAGSGVGDGSAASSSSSSRQVLRLLTLRSNCGKGAAIREGMLRMCGAYALMADADAAADISDLGRLLAATRHAEVSHLILDETRCLSSATAPGGRSC
jgi:hypothetical protein